MKKASLILSLFVVLLCLSADPVFAARPEPGDVCSEDLVGKTVMSDDEVNIVGCTKTTASGATYVWKNYLPDNRISSGKEMCEEGNVAIYSGGRFVCKNFGNCSDGDVVIYKDGRFMCEKKAGTSIMKNYFVSKLPVTTVPGCCGWPGEATATFTGQQLYNATISANKGLTLHSFTYVAKSSGRAKISVAIPFRYYQSADWEHWPASGAGYIWDEAIMADLYVNGVLVTEGLVADPDKGTLGSSGDIGRFIGNVPITSGASYNIVLKLVTRGTTFNALNTASAGWAGTMWLDDHLAEGFVEIFEYSAI